MTDTHASPSDHLHQIEEEIFEVDAGILNLLDRRMRLATEVWRLQKEAGVEVQFFDLEKEKERLFEKLEERNKALQEGIDDEEQKQLILIWGKIIELSNKIQEKEV